MNIVENFRKSNDLQHSDGSIVTGFVTVQAVPLSRYPGGGTILLEIPVEKWGAIAGFTVGHFVPGHEVGR